MAELYDTHSERESLGGGRYRLTRYIAPIAYRDEAQVLRPIVPTWVDGDAAYPHVVTASRLAVSTAADGMRRIHPTRESGVYAEIGAPYIYTTGAWRKVNLGTAARSGQLLTWTTTNANVYVRHGGHYIKLGILLKNGWVPPNGQFAFPVGLTGLTRTGNVIYRAGAPVMRLRALHVEDLDDPEDVRPVAHEFVTVGGQAYILCTLPSLTGMSRPLIDPTLTLDEGEAGADLATFIQQGGGADNAYGSNTEIQVGDGSDTSQTRRGLLQFDVSSIPADQTITSATLTLTCTTERSSTDYDVAAHRGLVQWYEYGGSGVPPGAYDGSTWNYRNANTNGQIAWSGGAGGVSGTEYAASATDTTTITATGAFDWDVLADVQAWYAGTATNRGWWLLNGSEDTANSGKYFGSDDHGTAASRPKLVVVYEAAGANLTATGIETNPTVGKPALGQKHALTATGIESNPTVGSPALTQAHALTATGIETNPTVGLPALAQAHALAATGIKTAPTVGGPALGQAHALTATGIESNPTIGSPALGQAHALTATGIETNPTTGAPAMGQVHALTATGIKTAPTVGLPALTQVHALTATGIKTTPTVGGPALGQVHTLTATGIKTTPEAGGPALAQVHALIATGIKTTPTVGQPHCGSGSVALLATGIRASPTVGKPALSIHVTPAERTHTVEAEDRIYIVSAEDRIYVVSAEDRVYVVLAG